MRIPFVRDWTLKLNDNIPKLRYSPFLHNHLYHSTAKYSPQEELFSGCRTDTNEEVPKQELYVPAVLPKLPGRVFGKPIKNTRNDTHFAKPKECKRTVSAYSVQDRGYYFLAEEEKRRRSVQEYRAEGHVSEFLVLHISNSHV